MLGGALSLASYSVLHRSTDCIGGWHVTFPCWPVDGIWVVCPLVADGVDRASRLTVRSYMYRMVPVARAASSRDIVPMLSVVYEREGDAECLVGGERMRVLYRERGVGLHCAEYDDVLTGSLPVCRWQ